MRRLFSRRSRVWGRDIDMLTLRVSDPVGRGFLRSGSAANPLPRELVIRPVQGEEHRALDAVRRADGHWLRPWEATLPPDTLEHVPTFAQYVRRADIDHREGTGLIFGVQVDGAYVGQFSISNVHWGAMSTGMLGYWILSEWAGRGLGSLVAALILDLVVGELGLHRVEVCVRPENERSLGVCRGLGLVEEGLRLEGLADIPAIVPTVSAGKGLTPAQKRRRAIGHALAYGGYVEILPTPFIRQDTFDTWGLAAADERRNAVAVRNPLDADYAIVGTTLLPSMLEAVARNVARGMTNLSLFGQQQVSVVQGAGMSPMLSVAQRPSDAEIAGLLATLPYQPLHVATVGTGLIEFSGPWGEGREYSYADAIESAKLVARAAGVSLTVENAEYLPWHPGRCAALLVDGVVVGHAGELHPQVVERLGLPKRTCAMELNVSALPLTQVLPAPVLSAFPAVKQDLALVVPEDVPAETVRQTIIAGGGDLLETVELFGVYRSAGLGADVKSLAFALVFRAPDRTLTDEECSVGRLAAAELAAERFGAHMRA